jgi:hypothetical protein
MKQSDLLTSPSEMSQWGQKLRDMMGLKDGWNSYSAPAPTQEAIVNASRFLMDVNILPSRVAPSAVAGVGITYRNGDRKVYVEFFNAGSAHALFADDSTQETHTTPVDLSNPQLFAQKIRDYPH